MYNNCRKTSQYPSCQLFAIKLEDDSRFFCIYPFYDSVQAIAARDLEDEFEDVQRLMTNEVKSRLWQGASDRL